MVHIEYDERIQSRYNLSMESILAMDMVKQWGMVAGIQDGEDSQGRHKLRLSTPEELVHRAFTVAHLFAERMEAEGHLRDLGPLDERQFLNAMYGDTIISGVRRKDPEEEKAERDAASERLKARMEARAREKKPSE